MKKRMQKVLACCLVLLCVLPLASFFSFAKGDVLTYSLSEQYGDGQVFAQVVSCDKNATGTVTVPSQTKIGGTTYDVKFILERAFADCIYIERITISEGITRIDNKAFENCKSLRVIDMPSTLMSTQYDVFDGCEDLTVNCYKCNYQFYTVYAFDQNDISFNIVDSGMTKEKTQYTNALASFIKMVIRWFQNLFKIKK